MNEVKKSVENALKDVHIFLNHPMKAGRLYITYDKEGVKAALQVLHDAIKNLEDKSNGRED